MTAPARYVLTLSHFLSGTEQLQPEHLPASAGQAGPVLSAIQEAERDSDDEAAIQEQAEADYEERLQIGGGLLKQVTIKSGYLLKKGERRKVGCGTTGSLLHIITNASISVVFCRLGRNATLCCVRIVCATTKMTEYV